MKKLSKSDLKRIQELDAQIEEKNQLHAHCRAAAALAKKRGFKDLWWFLIRQSNGISSDIYDLEQEIFKIDPSDFITITIEWTDEPTDGSTSNN